MKSSSSGSINDNGLIVLSTTFFQRPAVVVERHRSSQPIHATEKLRSIGARLNVIPLAQLPWTTKLNSNVSPRLQS